MTDVLLPFTNAELTATINTLPSTFGRLDDIFNAGGAIDTDIAQLDMENQTIRALGANDPSAPTNRARTSTEQAKFFKVPHIPVFDTIAAVDIRGRRELGQPNAPRTVEGQALRKLRAMNHRFAITREAMRMSALRGTVVDGANKTLVNLFTAFDVTEKVVDFELDVGTTDVEGKCAEVLEHIGENISDDSFSGIKVIVSDSFFSKLTNHAKVRDLYAGWTAAEMISNPEAFRDNVASHMSRRFRFGNLIFETYPGSYTDYNGVNRKFVAADTGHAYPMGTFSTCLKYVAPPVDIGVDPNGMPDDLGDAGAAGIHVTQKLLDHGVGIEMKGQVNEFYLVARPQLLVRVTV